MLTRATVNVVFEGNLSADKNLVQVLQEMLSSARTDTAVLRIACPSRNLSGRLAVARGRFIVGAQVDGDESGYAAVRKLLAVDDGNFAFLDTQGQFPFDVDPTLHIPVDRILELMPALPENPAELFDEKALLDEVFTAPAQADSGPMPGSAEVFPKVHEEQPGQLPEAQTTPESAWAALQPLLLDDSGRHQHGPLLAGLGRDAGRPVNVDERRITFGKLKAAALKRLSWRRPGILLAIVLLAALLATASWPHLTRWLAPVGPGTSAPANQR